MSRVRACELDDAATLAGLALLEQSLFGAEAWSAQALGELTATPGRRLLVIESETEDEADDRGAVLGYALIGVQGDFAELLRIGVAPDAQRGGLATMLLAEALGHARGDGAERMLLEVSDANTVAQAFYARNRFVEIDRRPTYYRDGSDALVLQRDVAPLDIDAAASGRMES